MHKDKDPENFIYIVSPNGNYVEICEDKGLYLFKFENSEIKIPKFKLREKLIELGISPEDVEVVEFLLE